ncbi:MAG: hypothetical protein R2932_03090 [Caldilineaceae bacterium]
MTNFLTRALLTIIVLVQLLGPTTAQAAPRGQSSSLQECDVITEETLQDELNQVTQQVVEDASAQLDVSKIVATQWRTLEMDRVIDHEVDAAVERVKSREDYWNKFLSGWSTDKAAELTTAVTTETFDSPVFHDKVDELSQGVAQQIGEEIAVLSAQSVSAAFFCLQTFINGNYSGALVSTFEEEVRVATEASTINESSALDNSLLTIAGQHKTALGGVGVIIVAQVSKRIVIELGETIAERVAGRIVGRVLGKAGSTIIPVAGWLIGAGLIAYDLYSSRDGALPQIQETLKSEEVKAGIRNEITDSIAPELRRELPQIAREISNQLYNEWRDVKRNIRQVLELAGENAAFRAILDGLNTPDELSKLVDLVGVLLPTVGREGLLSAVDDGTFTQVFQQPKAAFQIIADTGSIEEALTWADTVGPLLDGVVHYEIYKHQPPTGLDKNVLEKLLALDNAKAIQTLVLLTPETLQNLLTLSTENLATLAGSLNATELASVANYVAVLDQAQRNQLIASISSHPETVTQLSDPTLRDYLATHSSNFEEALTFLLSPKEGTAAFTDIAKVATGAAPWQLFLYKYGTGQSALAIGVVLVGALVLLRLIFGLLGWLISPVTTLFRR